MLNWNKFVNAIHYVCDKAADDPSVLGAVKLNKVLWYSDVLRYMVTGASITGEEYVKRQHGPVPRHVYKAIDELISLGRIVRGKVDHFGFMKTEFHSLVEPDISQFTPEEIAQIDEAFEHVCLKHTATSISEETHGVIWELASMGEVIPYSTVFASVEGEITEADVAWAHRVIAAQQATHP